MILSLLIETVWTNTFLAELSVTVAAPLVLG